MAYQTDLNGNIIKYKNQTIDCVIEISDDECDMLPDDDEYIDVVGLEANDTESQNNVVMQYSMDVQTDVVNKPVSFEHRPTTQKSHKIQYGCTMCSTNFSTAKKLFIHLRSFVESKNKDSLRCKFCEKVLCSIRRLKEHVIGMHNGSRYKCNWCTKSYVNLTCFETHKIVAHSSLKESLVSRSISPATFSSLLSQSSSSPDLPVSPQDWIPNTIHTNQWNYVHSTKNRLSCLRHPDLSHCICRLI